MINTLKDKLKDLPEKSGVYLMKNEDGQVIYVGKASVLKNRVKSYFNGTHTGKVAAMISNIKDVDWIITLNESEAFALEINLIKEYNPKYNIMLRDGKQYPYIKVDIKSDYPRVTVVRKVKNDGAKYYGPYFGSSSMHSMIETIRKVYPLRTCNKNISKIKGIGRPCLNYDINRCIGPCKADVTIEEYKDVVKKVCNFLDGNDEIILKDLHESMTDAATAQNYELAAQYRDSIEDIKIALAQNQRAIQGNLDSYDIIGAATRDMTAAVCLMIVRNGKIIGSNSIQLDVPDGSRESEIIEYFIKVYYNNKNAIPLNIIVSHSPDDNHGLEEFLGETRGNSVHIATPQKGKKKSLIDMAVENAIASIDRYIEQDKRKWDRTGGAVIALQNILCLEKKPVRIEAYDISNIQGVDSVASMVVFVEGVPSKKDYRRFKIKTVEGANDFASMAEVIQRRFTRGLSDIEKNIPNSKFAQMPDLVVIDGGKGQLSSARALMESLGIGYIETIGLAKREEEVFFPNESVPIIIGKRSPALHLLQRLRDEAHRFAITFHRSIRQKGSIVSELDSIPGIGPSRRRMLQMAFPTISAIRNATVQELADVEGITAPCAEAVYGYYHSTDDDQQ